MGISDFLRRLRKTPGAKEQLEEAAKGGPETRGAERLVAITALGRLQARLNPRIPPAIDLLILQALKKIVAAYGELRELKGDVVDALYESFGEELYAEVNAYKTMPTIESAKAKISLCAEKTARFAEILSRKFGTDMGVSLAAKQFARAVEMLKKEEASAAG